MAATNQFYQPEHLIPINKKNPASMLPKNIYTAVGKMGGQMEVMKNYVINNPKGPYTSRINELFTRQGLSTSENTIKLNKNISNKKIKSVLKNLYIPYNPGLSFMGAAGFDDLLKQYLLQK